MKKMTFFAALLPLIGGTLLTPAAIQQTTTIAPSPSVVENVYIVKPGDTLTDIALKVYGNEEYWTTLWNDNDTITHPSILHAGMKVKLRNPHPTHPEEILPEKMAVIEDQQTEELNPALAFATAVEVASPTNFDTVYQKAGAAYGIPWQILYGIHATESGLRDGPISNYHGSGAQGPMQFMPNTWKVYGIDGDGDGQADIHNAVDAIYSAANYLAKHENLEAGLHSYGGNISAIRAAACQRGLCE